MTIKHNQIAKVYNSVKVLSSQKLPAKKAYKVFLLTKRLEEILEFVIAEETKLIEKYNGKVDNGYVKIEDAERFEAFKKEIGELNGLESEVDIDDISLNMKDLENVKLSSNDFEVLNDIILFEE